MQSEDIERISSKHLPNSTPILERAEEDEVTNKDERSQANFTHIEAYPDPVAVAAAQNPSKETIHWSEEMKSNLNDPIDRSSLENFVRHVKSEEVDLKHKNAATSVSNLNLV